MEPEITRKEFVERFLPQKKATSMAFEILKYGIYVFITFIVFRVLFALPVSAWTLLGAIALVFLAFGYLSSIYKKQKEDLRRKSSLHLLPALEAIEKTFSIMCYMALGVIMYRTWLREPLEAYMIITVFLFLTLKETYEKRKKQEASDDASKSAS